MNSKKILIVLLNLFACFILIIGPNVFAEGEETQSKASKKIEESNITERPEDTTGSVNDNAGIHPVPGSNDDLGKYGDVGGSSHVGCLIF